MRVVLCVRFFDREPSGATAYPVSWEHELVRRPDPLAWRLHAANDRCDLLGDRCDEALRPLYQGAYPGCQDEMAVRNRVEVFHAAAGAGRGRLSLDRHGVHCGVDAANRTNALLSVRIAGDH